MPHPLNTEGLLNGLDQWSDAGWLRRLDSAVPRWIAKLDPQASPWLLLASALLVHLEGRGHSCLPLKNLVEAPQQLLAWPKPAEQALLALWEACPKELSQWVQVLQASTVVGTDTLADLGTSCANATTPLVLAAPTHEPRLYLRRYWQYERDAAQRILQAMQQTVPVDEVLARETLNRLFPWPSPTIQAGQALDWQKLSCALALRSRFFIITGGPGTGKTYTAARLLAALFATHTQPQPLRIMLAAPTGKAAARLKQSINHSLVSLQAQLALPIDLASLADSVGPARTLHALLGARVDTRAFRYHVGNPLDVDVLMVDEASMVHLEMMVGLLSALPAHARLVLLGDKDQLASVEAGALLGDLCRGAQTQGYNPETRRYALAVAGQALPVPPNLAQVHRQGAGAPLAQHTVVLRESHRFHGPIGQLATAVNQGDTVGARQVLGLPSSGALGAWIGGRVEQVVQLAVWGRADAPGGYSAYCQALGQRSKTNATAFSKEAHEEWVHSVLVAFERFRVLCAVREGPWGVEGLNLAIARELNAQGYLQAKGSWYAGRPVMVTRNDPALGVFNGDIGLALPGWRPPTQGAPQEEPPERLRVWFLDGAQLRSVSVSRLAHVETAFAMTVHKSQGSEYDHAVLVLPQHAGNTLSRELVYTGITRAKKAFTLVAQSPGLLEMAIEQVTQRTSGLLHTLDLLEEASCCVST